jgi:hypothetical protein
MHSDKIWAMDLHEQITEVGDDLTSKIIMVSGGSDSTLKLWEDYTIEQEFEDKEAELNKIKDE